MKYFLTGITGFIGSNLAKRLVHDGHVVHALVRNPGHPDLPKIENVRYFTGDLDAIHTLEQAMAGCDKAFHLAAFARPWASDPDTYYRINVEGAVNVFRAAVEAGVKKVVFTSTSATLSPSEGYNPVTESTVRIVPYFTRYEETKAQAEAKAMEFSDKGLPVVAVNPSRVFGPGPLNPSNTTTRMILDYAAGKWRIIPGDGKKVGNFVFIDDVVNGHILAAEKGRGGERYMLGGENLSWDEFFMKVAGVCQKDYRMVHLPLPVMMAAARFLEAQYHLTRVPPAITTPFVRLYLNHNSRSSDKAAHELGYSITPVAEGIRKTLEWFDNR